MTSATSPSRSARSSTQTTKQTPHPTKTIKKSSADPRTSESPSAGAHKNAIPFRDAVLQFCEKHLNKIKTYIDQVSARFALPIKATLEGTSSSYDVTKRIRHALLCCLESRQKKLVRLHFICFGQDEQCLYSASFFTMKTKLAKTWIHLMFLAVQVT